MLRRFCPAVAAHLRRNVVTAAMALIGACLFSVIANAGSLTVDGNLTYYGGPSCEDPCSEFSVQGHGVVRGLGSVHYSAVGKTDTSNSACGKSTAQLTFTTSKGTFDVNGIVEGCSTPFTATFQATTITFKVTSGAGRYQGMTGSGTLDANGTAVHMTAKLDAPSYTFDVTPPAFRGVVNHVARASTPAGARVKFTVTASDAVDGTVKASCNHASGSLFRVGTTRVTCSATDSTANVGHATFSVKVTRS